MSHNTQASWVVGFWAKFVSKLRRLSLFDCLTRNIPGLGTSRFVDFWVLGHLLLAIVGALLYSLPIDMVYKVLLILYGIARVFEVMVYQIDIALFAGYREGLAGKKLTLDSYTRIVILLFHNYIEIIFWFTLIYRHYASSFESSQESLASFVTALNYSFFTMSTFGSSTITPHETLGYIIVLVHSMIGLFMVLVILSRFIGLLPTPETRNPAERIP